MINNKIRKTLSIVMVICMLASFTACSKKEKAEETTTEATTETTIPVETTTAPTTSLSEFSGPDTNAVEEMTWTEEEMEPTTMYVTTADDYLNVRRGPDANTYPEVVSKLPRGTAVTVIASTSNGWYKTADGYYITGTYLSTNPV